MSQIAQPWTDSAGPLWPVSVKGVLAFDGRIVVLRNGRGEWELPGGRLEPDDPDPPAALRREMREELGLDVEVGELVDTWIYDVAGKRVLILTYRCSCAEPDALVHSDEHSAVAALSLDVLEQETIPAAYLDSIRRCNAAPKTS